ncbi:unnamed protein product, partial [Prorocentrum cordatum]
MPRARPAFGRLQAAGRSGSRSTFLKALSVSAASAAVRGRPPLGALSSLERPAIRPTTDTLYRSMLKGLHGYRLGPALRRHDGPTLDGLLGVSFNDLYWKGLGTDVGSGMLAAQAPFLPGQGRPGATLPPRASRAMLGRRRRTAPLTRLPLPRAAMGAIVGYPVHRGLLRAALLTAFALACYLKPQEMLQVRARHLIAPAVMAGPEYQCWPILRHDSTLLRAGKAGVHDGGVVIDMGAWLCPALACSQATLKPDDLILDLSFVDLRSGSGPPAEVIYHLKGALASELRLAVRLRRFAFLEPFAGSGQIGGALRAAGYACVSLDVNNGPLEDHLSPAFRSTIRGWLQGRVILGVWLGTPCTTWSRALRKPLRSIQAPMGLADLTESELARLQVGSDTFELSVNVIKTCVRLGIPVYLENPASS